MLEKEFNSQCKNKIVKNQGYHGALLNICSKLEISRTTWDKSPSEK